jgi:hypothetical protein
MWRDSQGWSQCDCFRPSLDAPSYNGNGTTHGLLGAVELGGEVVLRARIHRHAERHRGLGRPAALARARVAARAAAGRAASQRRVHAAGAEMVRGLGARFAELYHVEQRRGGRIQPQRGGCRAQQPQQHHLAFWM